MSKFKDSEGKESMMRKISWLISRVFVIWGSVEIGYSMIKKDFEIHSDFLLGTLSLIVIGKVGQSVSERFKK
tara:strand:- start:228 stop:443 length:216 start_codon:yes stop_codon:yes gene_type:complete